MAFTPKFGQAFEKLDPHDRAAVITMVMEAVRSSNRDVPQEWIPQFINRIAASPRRLDDAREWYERWQDAGHEANHLLKAIGQKRPGMPGRE